MNRGQIRELVSQWVDDPNNGYFTTSTLNTFINNALYEVQKRLIMAGENFYVTCVTTATVQNQAEYALPDDFWGIRRLRIITSGSGVTANKFDLMPITMAQESQFAATGTPSGFYLRKNLLVIVPAPTSDAWTLEMEYAERIGLMTSDADVPDVPEHFHEYIALLAAYNCFIKDDRVPSILQQKKEEYEKQLDEAAEARVMNKARTVVITSDGYYGNF